jgi:V8-like Glu-specific endopeptidase
LDEVGLTELHQQSDQQRSLEKSPESDLYRSVGGPAEGSQEEQREIGAGGTDGTPRDSSYARLRAEDGPDRNREIIGEDDRTLVTDTSVSPWSTICALRMSFRGATYVGSGCLIGPRLVLTCGHNVYDPRDGWAEWIEVTPGMCRSASGTPFGSVRVSGGPANLRTVQGWKEGDSTFDYGAVLLPANDRFRRAGAFSIGNFPRTDLLGATLLISGYPGEKIPHQRPYGDQWQHKRKCSGVDTRTLVYLVDTTKGQSGSAIIVVRASDQKHFVVGIHTNGSATSNSGTRINSEVFAQVQKWRQEVA